MYLAPEIDSHPSHSVQNPRQLVTIQEATVDWFDFWLNQHEDQTAEKLPQYERWRELRMLQVSPAFN
jgi:hypothetical protein